MDDRRETFWFSLAVVSALTLAAAFRFRDLSATLFEDEVWVAELVRRGGWKTHAWLTPPLFYALERGWLDMRGAGVAALREPAAIFGVLAAAVPLLALRLDRLTRFLWLLLLAFSSPLLFYSARLKQYTLEVTLTALLVVLLLAAIESGSRMAWLAFFAVALVASSTLYAPVFVLGGAAIAVIAVKPKPLLPVVAGFGIVFAVFAAAWFLWLAPGPESTALHGDMTEYFARNARWVRSPSDLAAGTLHWTGQALNLTKFWWIVAGVAALFWIADRDVPGVRKIVVIAVALVPPLFMAAASAFQLYPYGEVRLMTACFPAIFLLVASALQSVVARTTVAGGAIIILFCAAFTFNGIARDVYNATYMHVHDMTALHDFVERNHRSGERIFADPGLEPPLRFHRPRLESSLVRFRGTPSQPGWYVGYAASFDTRGSDLTFRVKNVVAARFTGPQAPPPAH